MNQLSISSGLLAITLILGCLGGCGQSSPPGKYAILEPGNIHEILANTASRAGYEPDLSVVHQGSQEIDSILISVPLDSLKREHPGLTKMLKSIGTICSRSEFANFEILIELQASDKPDMQFMHMILQNALTHHSNTMIIEKSGSPSFVKITVWHPAIKRETPLGKAMAP